MNVDTFTEKISQWLDHELKPNEVAELQAHLQGCETCRQTHQAIKQVDQMFRSAGTQLASPKFGFAKRFETRLAKQQVEGRKKSWLAIVALFLGTVLLFTFVISIAAGIITSVVQSTPTTAYQWQLTLFYTVENLRSILNLVMVLMKACLITMSQPLFWEMAIISALMAGISLRLLVYRQKTVTLQLFV